MSSKGSFLEDYCLLNKDTEIPDLFSLWCGLSTISAALGRSAWLDMGTFLIFPNMYVVLVAGSGKCRKSTAIRVAEGLLRSIDPPPNLISQKLSPEALIDALRQRYSDKGDELQEVCEGFVIADELSTFLNRKSYENGLANLLTPFYDCKESFEYRTKGRGIERILNACLGILGGSTVDWIRSALPEDSIGGGITSRIIFVYVDQPTPPVAITTFGQDKRDLVHKLVQQLQRIRTYVRGRLSMTKGAEKEYTQNYNRFYYESPFYNTKNLAGYASRRYIHVLKTALLFAASEENNTIELSHLEQAEMVIENTESHLLEVITLIGASDQGNMIELIYGFISKTGTISRADLLRGVSHRLTAREVTDLMDTLIQSNRVEVVSRGSKILYLVRKRRQ